jgi:spermidine synthase
MNPWRVIDCAKIPDGTELVLQQRGSVFAIRVDGHVLMRSDAARSEQQLARVSCSKLGRGARVLIGGLGMGFTLRAALDVLEPDARVQVAELLPAVVEWNRGPLADLNRRPLEDRRVTVSVGDVRAAWAGTSDLFDAIVLDVDNGPTALSHPSNARLYEQSGLREIANALRPGGVLSVWSAGPDERFLKRLHEVGLTVERERIANSRHEVLIGRKQRQRRVRRP